MSKAILVIDIPDKYDIDNVEILFDVYEKVEEHKRREILEVRKYFRKLKPMPERKEVRKVKYLNDVVYQQTTYDYIANEIHGQIIYDVDRIFAEGYNACLDEMLGEEE